MSATDTSAARVIGGAARPVDDRLTGADGVRAIACLWVMAAHLFMVLPPEFQLSGYPWTIVYHGHMGVGMFFVLSGFLLSQPYWKALAGGKPFPSTRVYAIRRLARIVPGYWCCVLVTALAAGAFRSTFDLLALGMTLTFTNSLFAATYLPPFNPPLWSISIEMGFYVLLPVVMAGAFALGRRKMGPALLFIVALMAAIALGHWYFLQAAPAIEERVGDRAYFAASSWATQQNVIALFAHFLIGVAAAWVLVTLRRRGGIGGGGKWNWCDSACLGAFVIIAATTGIPGAYIPHFGYMRYDWPVFHVLVAVILILAPCSCRVGRWLDNRYLRTVAILSFGLYMWHAPIFRWLREAWGIHSSTSTLSVVTFAIVSTTAIFAAAALSYVLVERPVLRWAHRK